MKQYDEIWSVSVERIRAFFEQEYGVLFGDGLAEMEHVSIRLTEKEDSILMKVKIPRTRVEIWGSEKETEEVHNKFFFRFLSAGG